MKGLPRELGSIERTRSRQWSLIGIVVRVARHKARPDASLVLWDGRISPCWNHNKGGGISQRAAIVKRAADLRWALCACHRPANCDLMPLIGCRLKVWISFLLMIFKNHRAMVSKEMLALSSVVCVLQVEVLHPMSVLLDVKCFSRLKRSCQWSAKGFFSLYYFA